MRQLVLHIEPQEHNFLKALADEATRRAGRPFGPVEVAEILLGKALNDKAKELNDGRHARNADQEAPRDEPRPASV